MASTKLHCGSVHFRGTNKCDSAHSHSRPFVYNRNVLPVGKTVCLFMVLLVLSAPLIACALPGEEMTKAEQDCCLQMSDECGGSQMSDSHTCCTKTPQVEGSTLKASSKYSPAAPQAAPHASLCAAPQITADRLPGTHNPCNDSPSPPGSTFILRI
jgi:hypothetical protein